jgi:hypothetical protein
MSHDAIVITVFTVVTVAVNGLLLFVQFYGYRHINDN